MMNTFLITRIIKQVARQFLSPEDFATFSQVITGYRLHDFIEKMPGIYEKVKEALENLSLFGDEENQAAQVQQFLMQDYSATYQWFSSDMSYLGLDYLALAAPVGVSEWGAVELMSEDPTAVVEAVDMEEGTSILEDIFDLFFG